MPGAAGADGRARAAYVHVHVPGADAGAAPLVLLHGSDGDEGDLMGFAAEVAPAASRVALRGDVATAGGFAFFRRAPDRRVDEADLRARLPALADFVAAASTQHGQGREPVVIGYSNGAIMAAALLVLRPELLAGAILLRPLFPLSGNVDPVLTGTPVLVIDGADDTRRTAEDGARTAAALRRAGASVTHHVLPVGHALSAADVETARRWTADRRRPGSGRH